MSLAVVDPAYNSSAKIAVGDILNCTFNGNINGDSTIFLKVLRL
jgi:hypothetical protein